MKASNHMNLGNPELERLTCRLDDFGDGHFERMWIAFPGAEGAELARKNADVGVIDVPIQDISGAIPVFSFTNDVGDHAEAC